jgi:aryl-alcohol dehydrogenase-like predicted oxidoreductase
VNRAHRQPSCLTTSGRNLKHLGGCDRKKGKNGRDWTRTNGLLDLCQQLNVRLVAYAPLATGLLTGMYTPEQPPTGLFVLRRGKSYIIRLQGLIRLMQDIGEVHGNKIPGQVALNWIIVKGALPIPGAKNALQAKENIGALGWSLTEAEVASLDAAAQLD